MQIAHIVPKAVKPIGKFHMLLLHLCMSSESYRETYKNAAGYKILDNSIIELGKALKIEDLCDMAEQMAVDEIVLPDVLGDSMATYALVKESLRYIIDRYNGAAPFKLMAVAQGKSPQEWLLCYHDLCDLPIHVIGIPKRVNKFISRVTLCEILEGKRDLTKEHHLLGMPGNPKEISLVAGLDYLRSVDSCIAYITARDGIDISPVIGCDRPEETINFDDEPSIETIALLHKNISTMGGWTK